MCSRVRSHFLQSYCQFAPHKTQGFGSVNNIQASVIAKVFYWQCGSAQPQAVTHSQPDVFLAELTLALLPALTSKDSWYMRKNPEEENKGVRDGSSSGTLDIQGRGNRILSGGVEMPDLHTEDVIQGCDVGELQEPGLPGGASAQRQVEVLIVMDSSAIWLR
ncbi:hypothetical protein P7K49_034995 [Saguinus oedipus]|uniref:Uncharacterized protein n=1 Tax=Saguinus oedipus TaxID=9490 RepID=A0ABQ9TWA0_SAGOE|nr:hypothetical protein P7K49_034995 [Saguinus oedipus]